MGEEWDGEAEGGEGNSRIKKANSCLSCPLSHFALCSTLSPFPLLSCSQLHPPLYSAVTSKAELYGLCARTIGVSGEAEILLNASRHTWLNYASPASTWSTSRHRTLSSSKNSFKHKYHDIYIIQCQVYVTFCYGTFDGLCYFIVTVHLTTISVARTIRIVEW